MRIAYIGLRCVPAAYSGVEVAVEEIGRRMVTNGNDVTVYCMNEQQRLRASFHEGMRLKYMPCLQSMNGKMISYAFISTVHSIFRSYDLVHFHALGPATLSGLPRIARKKTVVTVHGLDWNRAKWGHLARVYLKFGEWASSHCPNITTVVSETLRDYYAERFGEAPLYIPNGVPPAVRRDLAEVGARYALKEREYILFVGRLTPEKNAHDLIAAYRQVRSSMKLVVVGGAAAGSDYHQRVCDLARCDDRVVLTGPLYGDTVRSLFANAYLFVLPSALEGLPISLLEALSYGTPALVSDIPENLEVLRSASLCAGFTFTAGDRNALAWTIEELLHAPERVSEMGPVGKAVVEHKYDWDAVAKAYETMYRNVLNTPVGPTLQTLASAGKV